jgi:hypothetical protein
VIRGTLHVLGTLILVPYLILAAGFLLLGHAISRAQGSVWVIFDTLLHQAVWIIPWGVIGAAGALLALAALGVFPETRRLGGVCLAVLAAASLVVLVVIPESRLDAGALTFLVPCMSVLALGVWLAWAV